MGNVNFVALVAVFFGGLCLVLSFVYPAVAGEANIVLRACCAVIVGAGVFSLIKSMR